MARYALIRDADGRVVNIAEWDGDISTWSPPAEHSVRTATAGAEIGGTWDGSAFLPAPLAPPPDPQIAADKNIVATFMSVASGTATAAQRDDVTKAVIRYLRRSGNDA